MSSVRQDKVATSNAISTGNNTTTSKPTDTHAVIISSTLDLSRFVIEDDYTTASMITTRATSNPINIKTDSVISEEDFHSIDRPPRLLPPKARPLYDFAFENIDEVPEEIRKDKYFVYEPKFGATTKLNKSFHTTTTTHKTNNKKTAYIFKFNSGPGWFCDYAYMPQIESAITEIAAYYIGRDLCTVAYPVYNSKKKFVGVAVRKFDDLKPNKTHPLTREEVENPKKKKELAKILHWKFALNDADCNSNNIGNKAWDWDMGLFKKTCFFKRLNPYEAAKRNPRPNTFLISEEDIRNFPDLKKAEIKPWVTKKSTRGSTSSSSSTPSTSIINFITSTVSDTLQAGTELIIDKYKKYHPETDHDFSDDQQNVYKDLAKDKLFKQYLHIEILKNCLSNRSIDANAFLLHTLLSDVYVPNENGLSINAWYSNDVRLANQPLNKLYADDVQDNRVQWRDVTVGTEGTMPTKGMEEFHDFLIEHGADALEEICRDFEKNNERYRKKIIKIDAELLNPTPSNKPEVITPQQLQYNKERYQAMLMDIPTVKANYNTMFNIAKNKKDNALQAREAEKIAAEKLEIKEFDMDEFDEPKKITSKMQ